MPTLRFASIAAMVSAAAAQSPHVVASHIGSINVKEQTTTAAAAKATTTAGEMTPLGVGLYVLKYPQQACSWSSFTEGSDWVMNADSSDAVACAAGCKAYDGCTGFEVGSDSGSEFSHGPYCAFWLNDACSEPDESFAGAFSVSTGEYIQVDTYTLTLPLDAFAAYENKACAWSYYVEGDDWEFATKDSDDASACAKLCLDADGCTGFEIGSSLSTQYGDLTNGYCALWMGGNCQADDMLQQQTEASTYLLMGSMTDCDYRQHMFYVAMLVASLLCCVGVCCCCRRAMIRRRLAMQRAAAAGAHTLVRARAVTTATVTTAAVGDRAMVYAVRVADDQVEPTKL